MEYYSYHCPDHGEDAGVSMGTELCCTICGKILIDMKDLPKVKPEDLGKIPMDEVFPTANFWYFKSVEYIMDIIKKSDRRKKMENRREIFRSWIMTAIAAFCAVTLWWTGVNVDGITKGYEDIVTTQQELIESQQTVINVEEGLLEKVMIQNNKNAERAEEYRNKWLEELDK